MSIVNTAPNISPGMVVRVVNTLSSAVATGTTLIPFDDTIPQNTEGTEFMTLAITPQATTNILVIQAVFFGAHSVLSELAMALFQDTTANALAATSCTIPVASYRATLTLTHTMTAGTTSATTFKIRGGGNTAGTTTFNGVSAGRIYGAITKSSIVIWEY